jgi:hypothetical protein
MFNDTLYDDGHVAWDLADCLRQMKEVRRTFVFLLNKAKSQGVEPPKKRKDSK